MVGSLKLLSEEYLLSTTGKEMGGNEDHHTSMAKRIKERYDGDRSGISKL